MTSLQSESENTANAPLSADVLGNISPNEPMTGDTSPTILNVAFAPGCFGSAVNFNLEDQVCQKCVFADQCEPVHIQSVVALSAHFALHGDPVEKAKKKRNTKEREIYAADVLDKTGRTVTPHSKDAEENAQRERDQNRARAANFRAAMTPEKKAAANAIRAEKTRLKRAANKAKAPPK